MYGSYTGRSGARTRPGAGLRTGTAAVIGAVLLLAGCSSSDGGDTDGPAAVGQQPKGSDPFWVDPDGTAAQQVADYAKSGEDENADLIRKIARQPVGVWIGPDNAEDEVKGVTGAAEEADREALLVLYNIPHRDCGQFSKGERPTATPTAPGWRAWPRASATAGPR